MSPEPTPTAVTRDAARRALAEHAHRTDDGRRWWFSDPLVTHNEDAAVGIAEACLTLGVPVDDVMTSAAWLEAVRRLADLHTRVDRLKRLATVLAHALDEEFVSDAVHQARVAFDTYTQKPR